MPQKNGDSPLVVYWKDAGGAQKQRYWDNLPTAELQKLLALSKMKDGWQRRTLIRRKAWLRAGGYSDNGFHDAIHTAIICLHDKLKKAQAKDELRKLQGQMQRIFDSCPPNRPFGPTRDDAILRLIPRIEAAKKLVDPDYDGLEGFVRRLNADIETLRRLLAEKKAAGTPRTA